MTSIPNQRGSFVGLDYAQSGVQVCVLDSSGRVLANRLCRNDWRSIQRVATRFGPVRRAAVEACCGAADLAEELVERARWLVDLARVGYLPRVWLAPETIRELRRLTRYRQQQVNQRRAIKLRILAVLREQRIRQPTCTRWCGPWLSWLTTDAPLSEQARWVVERWLRHLAFVSGEIDHVMQRLRELLAEDPVAAKLQSLPGIGEVTAFTLRAEIGRFDRFHCGKQLSRFCGLSPRNASSGERQADAGLIRAANGQLRSIVIEAAHRLARYDARWSAMRHRLRTAGKPGSVIAGAVGNRWLRWLYHEMKPLSQAA